MTCESNPSDYFFEESSHSGTTEVVTGTKDCGPRDALQAMGAYSAFVGATGVVVLSAEEVGTQRRQCRNI